MAALKETFGRLDEKAQEMLLSYVRDASATQTMDSGYAKRVLRRAMDTAESDHEALHEDLVLFYTELLLQPASPVTPSRIRDLHGTFGANVQEDSWRHKTLTYGTRDGQELGHVTLRISANILQGGTGCRDWEAGHLMGLFALNYSSFFAGRVQTRQQVSRWKIPADRVVLELGCGTGATAVCLHRAAPCALILTDGNEETVQNCQHNLIMNGVKFDVSCSDPLPQGVVVTQLEWRQECPWMPEILIGADLLYDTSPMPKVDRRNVLCLVGCIPSLVTFMERALITKQCRSIKHTFGGKEWSIPIPCCFLLTLVRNPETMQTFVDAIHASQLHMEDISYALQDLDIEFFCLPMPQGHIVMHLLYDMRYRIRKRP